MAEQPKPTTSSAQTGALGCLVRLYWMMLGHAVLFFSLLLIARAGGLALSAADVVYWAAVFSLVVIRYVDVRYLGGSTSTGQPASLSDWRRYALLLTLLSLVAWAAAHGLAYAGVLGH